MKIFKEITNWKVPYRQPNHVYLLDGDKIVAYSRWGQHAPEYSKSRLRLDRRGRKFVEVPNTYGFVFEKEKPSGKSWTVKGSKGDVYDVTEEDGNWTCTCAGFKFRGECRHIKALQSNSVD